MLNAIVLVSAEIKEFYSFSLVVSMLHKYGRSIPRILHLNSMNILIEERKKMYKNQKPHIAGCGVWRNVHYTAIRYWYRIPTTNIRMMWHGMP